MFWWATAFLFLSPEAKKLQSDYEQNAPVWSLFITRVDRLAHTSFPGVDDEGRRVYFVSRENINKVFHNLTKQQITVLHTLQKNQIRRIELIHGSSNQSLKRNNALLGYILSMYNEIPMQDLSPVKPLLKPTLPSASIR